MEFLILYCRAAYLLQLAYMAHIRMLESWDEAKDRLFIVVYNKDRHGVYLTDRVHTCIEDLAIVPRLLIGRRSDGIMSIMVSQKLLKTWGKTEKEVMAEAFKSAPVVMPIEIRNMGNLVKEMLFNMKEAGENIPEGYRAWKCRFSKTDYYGIQRSIWR